LSSSEDEKSPAKTAVKGKHLKVIDFTEDEETYGIRPSTAV
jgi:hypothetical protein